MEIADLNTTKGRRFPARRLTNNITGATFTIQSENFCMGMV